MTHLALIGASADQLDGILRRRHEWEEKADPSARELPRPKRHDDKTSPL